MIEDEQTITLNIPKKIGIATHIGLGSIAIFYPPVEHQDVSLQRDWNLIAMGDSQFYDRPSARTKRKACAKIRQIGT